MSQSTKSDIIKDIIRTGKLHFYSESLDAEGSMTIRRKITENLTASSLPGIANPDFNIAEVSTKNCENLIGKTDIPLGIAGPLAINGDYAKGNFYIPLATTEGALVASINRGCKIISDSGGAYVYIEQYGITRAPLFVTKDLKASHEFVDWIKNHLTELTMKVKESGSHINLLSVTPYIVGRNVFLRFVFDTEDAMGMNMVTFACDYLVKEYIEKETKVKCLALSGNACIDKKPSWINKIEKRGYSLHADITIPKDIVKKTLKTDSVRVEEIFQRKIMVGSSISGAIGFNAHQANIVAALFLATGQDIAHVVEGSSGTTIAEKLENGDLYFSVTIPSLILGTVGGGTNLATQKEALSILGVAGGGNPPGSHAKKFAEIAAVTILAGEISLLSALTSDNFVKAHKKLGRGENVQG